MNHIVISVLLIIVGLILGLAVSFIINLIRGNLTSKKLEELVNKTKKEIKTDKGTIPLNAIIDIFDENFSNNFDNYIS